MKFHTAFLLLSTASALAYDCPPVGEFLVPHPNCSKYIVCAHGIDTEMSCPANLYFNPRGEWCDFPGNVPECMGGTRSPSGTTTPLPPAITSTEVPDPNVLTKCGDTMTANSGRIEYKFQQPYDANELCSFIIRSNGNSFLSGLVFTLEAHGFNATSDPNAIHIFTFDDRSLIESTHLGPPNPLTEAFLPGGIAVIVFKTQSNLGTGFKLSYRAVDANTFMAHSGLLQSNDTKIHL